MITTNTKITYHSKNSWLTRLITLTSISLILLTNHMAVQAQTENDTDTAASASTTAYAPPPSPLRNMNELAKRLSTEESLWLGEGEERALAAYRPALKDRGLTGVLLLSAAGQAIDQAKLLRQLRTGLAEHRWPTLAIHMPAPATPAIAKRELPPGGPAAATETDSATKVENPTDNAGDQSADASATANDVSMQRIRNGVNALIERGSQQVVIIAEGHSASMALQFASNPAQAADNQAIAGLILLQTPYSLLYAALAPYLPSASSSTAPGNVAKPLAIADYYAANISRSTAADTKALRQQRRRLFTLSGIAGSLDMPNSVLGSSQYTEKRIRGWLGKLPNR